jgi:hypothetical protein
MNYNIRPTNRYRLYIQTGACFPIQTQWAIIVIRVFAKTGDRWRTHTEYAKIGSLARGWAVLVALRTEEFVSSSSL